MPILFVHGEQESTVGSAIADTGAALSYISRDFAARLSLTLREYHGPTIQLADGHQFTTCQSAELSIRLGPVHCHHEFAILPGLPADCLLGLDFLSLQGIMVDAKERCLRFSGFPDRVLPFDGHETRHFVCCAADFELPADSEAWVEIYISNFSEGLYLCEPLRDAEAAKKVLLGRTLASAATSHLLIANLSNHPRTIKRGSRLATATPVDESDVFSPMDTRRPTCSPSYRLPTDLVIGTQLSDFEQAEIRKLLLRLGPQLFATDDRPYGRTSAGSHPVLTGEQTPIAQGMRPTAPADRQVVREEVRKMLETGAIRPSSSPWASPIVLVRKKDGSVRFCVDYRKLNDATKKDVHPLPRTSDMLESLAGAKIFTTLDAASGYWQIPMSPPDIEKTAFICSEGLFEFTVMPFGLCNAPATYQRLMNLLLAGLTWQSCLVYIDDIIIFSADFATHRRDLEEVLQRLIRAGFLLKGKKCRFAVDRVEYLGHIVTPQGISPDPAKIAKLRAFPIPTSVTEVRAFLGLAGYYRKFIRDFSIIAGPLFDLLKDKAPFDWKDPQQRAFTTLIDALVEEAVLLHPQFDEPFIVDTDASDQGLGAVCSQVRNGVEHPVAFASRRLLAAESKWHIREKEALGIVWALETFRHYLLGSQFSVRTDHSSLQWLREAKTGRLCRWALRLAEFGDFPIVHRSGKMHSNVDAFTRSFAESEEFPDRAFCGAAQEVHYPQALPSQSQLLEAQSQCERCHEAKVSGAQNPNGHLKVQDGIVGIDGRRFRPLLPDSLVESVVRTLHEAPHHAHLGARRTYAKLAELFELRGGMQKVTQVLQRCLACKQRKPPLQLHGKLASVPPSGPFDTVSTDFCGPYVTSHAGNRYILVFIDNFTKYVELVPTPDQVAKTVCQAFYREVICRHGCPARLLSDQGPQFKSELVEQLCGLFGIQKIFSSTYYPQGDGLAERFMRTLNNSLSILSQSNVEDWDEYVCGIQFAYNSSIHAATGFTPFALVTGRSPSFPEEGWLRAAHKLQSRSDYLRSLHRIIAKTHAECSDALFKSWSDLKRRFDARRRDISLPIDSTVLVRLTDYERAKFSCRKLAPRWSEPAVVLRVLGSGKVYEIRRADGKVENVNVARLLPLAADVWTSHAVQAEEAAEASVAPVPVDDDSEDEEVVVRSVPSPPAQVVPPNPSAVPPNPSAVPPNPSAVPPNPSPPTTVRRPASSPSPSTSSSDVSNEHPSDGTFSTPSSLSGAGTALSDGGGCC